MKFPLFDSHGRYAGEGDVPDDVMDAACRVRAWMGSNNVTLLGGLRIVGPFPTIPNLERVVAAGGVVPFKPE